MHCALSEAFFNLSIFVYFYQHKIFMKPSIMQCLIKHSYIHNILNIFINQYRMKKQRSLDQFEVVSRLGQGAFGQVFKVKRKQDGTLYALKTIKTKSMKQKDRINALNQIRILASIVGDHVIGYKDSFYDQRSSDLCIILQFAGRGDIARLIKQHSKSKKFIQQPEIWKAMVHIAKGIRVLHDNNVLHRDLKSANIFITQQGLYKLGDLNISKVLNQGLARTQTGTPYYCSPQVWKDTPYGPKSDVWSFGCVLYQMAAQKPPFTASDIQGLYRKICTGVFQRIPNCYSNQLSQVINSMLNLNPDLRPSTHDILKNPIVKKNYNGQTYEQINKSQLLQTIIFNNEGWKNINSNLPKSQYQIQMKNQLNQEMKEGGKKSNKGSKNQNENQNQNQNYVQNQRDQVKGSYGSNLKIQNRIRVTRPLSSKSDRKRIKDNEQTLLNNKSQVQQQQPPEYSKRQTILSAGKRQLGSSNLITPQKRKFNRNLVLPPVSQRRERRGSDNYDNNANMLPPKPVLGELRKDTGRVSILEKMQKSSSQEKQGYRINVSGVRNTPQKANRYY